MKTSLLNPLLVIGAALSIVWIIALVVVVGDRNELVPDAKRGRELCARVDRALHTNLAILRGPRSALQAELLQTIGSDRFTDGADALALCTRVEIGKIAICRLQAPDPTCMADLLEASASPKD